MSPMQQMFLGLGAVAKKTYIDDIFSTYLWTGNGSNSAVRTMANGIDLAGEGGMVWIKNRDTANVEAKIVDTVRGLTGSSPYYVMPSENNAQGDRAWNWSFLNNGFSFNQDYSDINGNEDGMASWTFRKAPGFFDVVTYTGTGSNRTIAHSLGCVPGLIMVKRTSNTEDWLVYHNSTGNQAGTGLNQNAATYTNNTPYWNSTTPTDSVFTLGTHDRVNTSGETYVAYLFAGKSFQDDAVQFDGSTEGLTLAATSDFHFGTDDFTIECFTRRNSDPKAYSRVWAFGPYWNNADSHGLCFDDGDHVNRITWANYRQFNQGTVPSNARVLISTTLVESDRWYHVAVTRKSGVFRLFIDGKLEDTNSSITTRDVEDSATNTLAIGRAVDRTAQEAYAGEVSNFRVVNGQALYTADFNPSGSPLTQTSQGATSSNVKLLCCQHASATGSSVTPGTITAEGSPSMTTARIGFAIDEDACVFGESGTEPVISCGSYVGNGSSTGPEIKLGWEPQWVLIRRTDSSENWFLWDSMRGIVTGANDARLIVNSNGAENDSTDRVDLTSTGFKPKTVSGEVNASGGTYIYMCLRRPDGYVGKPPELGTDVFAMDTGDGNPSPIPTMTSNFPVDFGTIKLFASNQGWYTGARLSGDQVVFTDDDVAEETNSILAWDSNKGFWKSLQATYQGWMWKRHAGFDVVTYTGGGTGQTMSHSLNAVPEMIWVKCRSGAHDWAVYHKGLNGGTNPEQKYLVLNSNAAEVDNSNRWGDTAPTATTFTVGGANSVGDGSATYLAMLFASVNKISKVGYYTGNGSSTGPVISLGFTPRFILFKNASSGGNGWAVLDTVRGLGTSSQKRIWLDGSWAQDSGNNYVTTTSTSFQPVMNNTEFNENGSTIIYYAHA